MIEIEATLPLLGAVPVRFFDESEQIYEQFKREIKYQAEIDHLGLASKVFTGINHSRLEYTLLQCAIVRIITKLHKDNNDLALSGDVKVPGLNKRISSGSELLKSWVLLNSIGHANYTFGTERVLLKQCIENKEFHECIISRLPAGMKRWASTVISEYRYERFFKILTFIQLNDITHVRVKNVLVKIYKSVVVAPTKMAFDTSQEKEKFLRLRKLHHRVRMIAQIAIDSFYSHLPVELKINQLLMNLDTIISDRRRDYELNQLFSSVGSYMAKGIYLHPKSLALTAKYEKDGIRKIKRRDWKGNFDSFLRDVRSDGLGVPELKEWANLIRITLKREKIPRPHIHRSVTEISKRIGHSSNTHVTIVNNLFSNEQYVDVACNRTEIKLADIFYILWNLYLWFVEKAENTGKQSLIKMKKRYPKQSHNEIKGFLVNYKVRTMEQSILDFTEHGSDILSSLLSAIILPKYRISIVCPDDLEPHGVRIHYLSSGKFDNLQRVLEQHVSFYADNKDKKKELECLEKGLNDNKSDLVLCCFCSIFINDINGKNVDQWDGVIVSISELSSSIAIYEVKNRGTSSVAKALKQLKDTEEFINNRIASQVSLHKLPGYGAKMIIE
jgi:hypothetical protein